MTYKDIDVMREWDKFENVEIGAIGCSLSEENLRKGQLEQVEANRKECLKFVPQSLLFQQLVYEGNSRVSDFH